MIVEQLVLIILDFQQKNQQVQQQNERLQERVDELERELGRRKPEEPKPDRYSLREQDRQEKAKQKRRKKPIALNSLGTLKLDKQTRSVQTSM